MTYKFVELSDALHKYPAVAQALGSKWITKESAISPIASDFPLARSLRIAELQGLMQTLDRRLNSLARVSGIKDWRDRLRTDRPGFRELQTEIAFADLLQKHGFPFSHPSKGPDFEIDLGDECSLLIEVTTPREIAWDDDLTNRLWMLSREYSYSLTMVPLDVDSPILSEAVTEARAKAIVSEAVTLLESASPKDVSIVQSDLDLGLSIQWEKADYPRFLGRNSPHSSNFQAFRQIQNAAEKKAKQLREAGARALLIGTNQLSQSNWLPYIHLIRNNHHSGIFDWSQIDAQVDLLIFFEVSYGDSRVHAVDYLVRPGTTDFSCEGMGAFFGILDSSGQDYLRQSRESEQALVKRLIEYEAAKSSSGSART